MLRKIVFVVFVGAWFTGVVKCDLPDDGLREKNGRWYRDPNGRYRGPNGRYILQCHTGFEPSGCHVLRKENGHWNYDVPVCQEVWQVSGKAVAAVGVGVAAVVATPLVISGVGFTAAGVAASSVAAWLQTPFTAAGSWFALTQSAGVVGTAATTKLGIGTVTGGVTYMTAYLFSAKCEQL